MGDPRQARFKNGMLGETWRKAFFNRHKDVVPRIASSVTLGMAQVSEYSIRKWHNLAKVEVQSFEGAANIFDEPRRIWNADETAFSLDGSK